MDLLTLLTKLANALDEMKQYETADEVDRVIVLASGDITDLNEFRKTKERQKAEEALKNVKKERQSIVQEMLDIAAKSKPRTFYDERQGISLTFDPITNLTFQWTSGNDIKVIDGSKTIETIMAPEVKTHNDAMIVVNEVMMRYRAEKAKR